MAIGFVGAKHAFHDVEFMRDWARRFVPTGPRLQLFDTILSQIEKLEAPAPHVLELGVGPGYMARHILERSDAVSYEALDFSSVVLDIARETLGDLAGRVSFVNADLLDQNWPARLSRPPHAIVSTWALHDLGGRKPIADVYSRCREILSVGGVLVNGDFIKPAGTAWEYEEGRFEIDIHLDMLRQAGFADPRVIEQFEINTVNPTTAQNYACLVANC